MPRIVAALLAAGPLVLSVALLPGGLLARGLTAGGAPPAVPSGWGDGLVADALQPGPHTYAAASAGPRAVRVAAHAPVRHARAGGAERRTTAVGGPTGWAALNQAIARIPTYRSGVVRWVVEDTGWLGTTDWFRGVIYVARRTPASQVYSVAVHEWSHELSVLAYGGDVDTAVAAMSGWFGGSGLTGAERAADCMAKLQGATYLHYTSCGNARWVAGARLLLAGRHLTG